MIKKVYIRNFKGLTELSVDNISRITIFGGKNNVGKSTLLEALFMFLDRFNANMTIRQLNWRGVREISLTPNDIFYPIFNDFNINNTIEIDITNDHDITETIHIKLKNQSSESFIKPNIKNSIVGAINTNQEPLPTTTLEINYKRSNDNNRQIINLFLNKNGMGINSLNGNKTNISAAFLPAKSHVNPSQNAIEYSNLDIDDRSESIVDFLNIIEPRLKSLSVITSHSGHSMIYGDIGLSKKLPISYMGDGMSRLLSIILSIASNENGIVFIDEIENGIHYSVMPKIWEALMKASRQFNCQIITTTHSYECIQAAILGLADNNKDDNRDGNKDDFSYFRLEKNKKKNSISAKYYDYDVLNSALENGWEVR